MATYHHRVNVHRRDRLQRRARLILAIPLLAILLLVVGGGVYIYQQLSQDDQVPQKSRPVTLGYYAGSPKRLVTNELFSFESTKEWQLSRETSRLPYSYVYTSQIDGFVEYELVITLNSQRTEEPVNYVAPIIVKEGKLEIQKISPRCDSNKKPKPDNELQEYEGVKFTCAVLSSKEVMAAAVVGGNYNIPLYNSRGGLVTVNIFFRNHTDTYQPDPFSQVVSSFRLK